MIAGRATADGTRRRAGERSGYRLLGKTELTVSVLGFGGYRVGRTDPDHRAALEVALAAGVNLLDTSSNYMFGDSERLFGEVLAAGSVPREEVVVVSKVGYIQGPNLELARQREAEGRPFPEVVKYAEGVWHCLAPEFIEDQLGRSLERLGLETLDVLLLHNPEYFLSDAAQRSDERPLEVIRAEFYDRLGRAFQYLDGAVADGRIAAYGVSSNTCVDPIDSRTSTSVVRMHQAAGGRMAVLQLPYNLLEPGALLEPNNPVPAGSGQSSPTQAAGSPVLQTALEAAQRLELGVLVNRPLNAASPHGALIRLADPPSPGAPTSEEALRARVDALAESEARLGRLFGVDDPPRASALIRARWNAASTPQGWAMLMRGELGPEVRRGLSALAAAASGRPSPEQAQAFEAYQEELNGLAERFQSRANLQNPHLAASIRGRLAVHLPDELKEESLSRLALDFVVSSPGVNCALNGMRHPAYVADAVGVMRLPPIPDVFAVARTFGTEA